MLPKFLPFKGKYVSVRAVWRHNAPQEATRATVFSSRPHTMRDVVNPLLVPLKAATEPLQTRWGYLHNNWRLPTTPRSFTTMEYGFEATSTVLLFWTILGFIFHFYIIFGTNVLTGGPAQTCWFLPISVFRINKISNAVQRE